jgi:hypothetical protein
MRRPLNWVVVSISLLVLFANRMYAKPDLDPASTGASLLAPSAPMPSPFAYVREDGSQQFLPLVITASGELEAGHARQFEGISRASADPRIAVYTWSTPVAGSEPRARERQAFQ